MKFIDDFLNTITMYRLLLYYLIVLLVAAFLFSFLGIIHYSSFSILLSTLFLICVCWITNTVFAKVFGAVTNLESVYISALILALILTPIKSTRDLPLFFWTGVWAMASKYIFAINKKHLFNPVAFGAVVTAFTLGQSASWWVSTQSLMPIVLIGGILIVRKIQRFDMTFSFVATALITLFTFSFLRSADLLSLTKQIIFDSPLLFFTFVMLTEPLTTPPSKKLQTIYGIIVGFLFIPQVHIAGLYFSPELALLVGNIYSYIVSPKSKLVLSLSQKQQIAPDINDFVFPLDKKLNFIPGQYMEWTIGHKNPDSRGSRRYFTLASSPTEDNIRLGVKFYDRSSSFKRSMYDMDNGSKIVASQLAGDFTLPKDKTKKIVLIAGGIGVTPYRSMIKYLLDINQKRDIVIIYSNKTRSEIVYKDIFELAEKKLGIKTAFVLTDMSSLPNGWTGLSGRLNKEMIKQIAPDYGNRVFYLSGPRSMVTGFESTLSEMNIKKSHIKIDFFPGFV